MREINRNVLRAVAVAFAVGTLGVSVGGQQATPRQQPGAEVALYAPEQHDLYDGHFVLTAQRLYMVGTLNDPPGWNHIGNDASSASPVEGTVEIDVNEAENTGRFVARMSIPEGNLVLEFDRFHEFNPCQDGGVAAYIYEHGDSGCGDTNWPKTFIYLAGMGLRSCDAEQRAVVPRIPDALHGHAGDPKPPDPARELPVARQDVTRRRGEPRRPTGGLLHSQSGNRRTEQPDPARIRPLLRDGSHVEVRVSAFSWSAVIQRPADGTVKLALNGQAPGRCGDDSALRSKHTSPHATRRRPGCATSDDGRFAGDDDRYETDSTRCHVPTEIVAHVRQR